jgi:hypothetical protein
MTGATTVSKFDLPQSPTEVTRADQEEVGGMKRDNESRIGSHRILSLQLRLVVPQSYIVCIYNMHQYASIVSLTLAK